MVRLREFSLVPKEGFVWSSGLAVSSWGRALATGVSAVARGTAIGGL